MATSVLNMYFAQIAGTVSMQVKQTVEAPDLRMITADNARIPNLFMIIGISEST